MSELEGHHRVGILETFLRLGLAKFRTHCNAFRRKLRVLSNIAVAVYSIKVSLSAWEAHLAKAADQFGMGYHRTRPPDVEDRAEVVVPEWEALVGWINSGGLKYLLELRQRPFAATPDLGAREATQGRVGMKSRCCFAFAFTEGCSRSAHHCLRLHELPPGLTSAAAEGIAGAPTMARPTAGQAVRAADAAPASAAPAAAAPSSETRGTGSAARQGYSHTTRGTTHRGRGGGGDEERPKSIDRSSTSAGSHLRHLRVKFNRKSLARSSQGRYASVCRSWEPFRKLVRREKFFARVCRKKR